MGMAPGDGTAAPPPRADPRGPAAATLETSIDTALDGGSDAGADGGATCRTPTTSPTISACSRPDPTRPSAALTEQISSPRTPTGWTRTPRTVAAPTSGAGLEPGRLIGIPEPKFAADHWGRAPS